MDRESPGPIPFCSFMPLPQGLSQVLSHCCWTPNHGWVLLGVGTPSLPPPPLRGAGPIGPAFTFAPLPSLPLPQDPHGWRGPRWVEDQVQDLNSFLGVQVGRGNLAMLPFDPLPSQWFSNFPLWVWDPFPSPRHPSGALIPSHLHFSSPFTLPMPHFLPSHWGFLLFP